jgi:uncharacterized protein
VNTIRNLLHNTGHRPWPIPNDNWKYYQEWHNALFLHWPVPVELIQPAIPSGLIIDEISGTTYISLVAFTMQNIRLRYVPAFPPVSNFHEINLRAYVTLDNKPGIYFFSIEASKQLSALVSRTLAGLPYEYASINVGNVGEMCRWKSQNMSKGFKLETEFQVTQEEVPKNAIENWLTERYCLYQDEGRRCYRYQIHHHPWQLKKVSMNMLQTHYRAGGLTLHDQPPELVHYSPGVEVIAWKRELVREG